MRSRECVLCVQECLLFKGVCVCPRGVMCVYVCVDAQVWIPPLPAPSRPRFCRTTFILDAPPDLSGLIPIESVEPQVPFAVHCSWCAFFLGFLALCTSGGASQRSWLLPQSASVPLSAPSVQPSRLSRFVVLPRALAISDSFSSSALPVCFQLSFLSFGPLPLPVLPYPTSRA